MTSVARAPTPAAFDVGFCSVPPDSTKENSQLTGEAYSSDAVSKFGFLVSRVSGIDNSLICGIVTELKPDSDFNSVFSS